MSRVLIVLVVLLLVSAGGFLAMWEIPAPNQPTQKVLPDERFPR
ncbi:MAG: hypothetical protein QF578_19780 [Alphaproteobacteria bacterium]|nr:hypothetical protein [Alphaproteobacteria bacterium]MDP6567078.1 hypothetical protein [Alphaproteobacteria bacterium]